MAAFVAISWLAERDGDWCMRAVLEAWHPLNDIAIFEWEIREDDVWYRIWRKERL